MQSIRHLSFLHTFCKAFYAWHSNSCISTPIENWTHIYMNVFTRNSPHYHLLRYLLFLLKHPVYNSRNMQHLVQNKTHLLKTELWFTVCQFVCSYATVGYLVLRSEMTDLTGQFPTYGPRFRSTESGNITINEAGNWDVTNYRRSNWRPAASWSGSRELMPPCQCYNSRQPISVCSEISERNLHLY